MGWAGATQIIHKINRVESARPNLCRKIGVEPARPRARKRKNLILKIKTDFRKIEFSNLFWQTRLSVTLVSSTLDRATQINFFLITWCVCNFPILRFWPRSQLFFPTTQIFRPRTPFYFLNLARIESAERGVLTSSQICSCDPQNLLKWGVGGPGVEVKSAKGIPTSTCHTKRPRFK